MIALSTDKFQGGSDKSITGTKLKIKMIMENFKTCTWNVSTPITRGRVKKLKHKLKRYKWDKIGFADMRSRGFGETTSEDGHKIY